MPKRRAKLVVAIPDYPTPGKGLAGERGMAWRRAIHRAARRAAREQEVIYESGSALQVDITLYLASGQMRFHDVDNLTKHLFDALQGRLGGTKSMRAVSPVVPNDAQFQRLTIEKRERCTKKQKTTLRVTGYVTSKP
jgi:Holliday junction resolvase RusA-like endonuclease